MPPIKINHVAVVVEDIPAALAFWQRVLGLPVQRTVRNDEEAVETAFLTVGDSEIELVTPTTADSGVSRYLARTGGGLHHLCLEVACLETTMQQISAAGGQLINDRPKTHPDGTRYAFVHPKSTGGVLLELYELPES